MSGVEEQGGPESYRHYYGLDAGDESHKHYEAKKVKRVDISSRILAFGLIEVIIGCIFVLIAAPLAAILFFINIDYLNILWVVSYTFGIILMYIWLIGVALFIIGASYNRIKTTSMDGYKKSLRDFADFIRYLWRISLKGEESFEWA